MNPSYYTDYSNHQEPPKPTGPNWTLLFGLLIVGILALIVVGLFYGPTLRQQWLESDPEFILEKRRADAMAEADLLFRKREAIDKADAEAVARRLDKVEIAQPVIREVVTRSGPAVVHIRSEIPAEERLDRQPGIRFGGPRFVQVSEGSGVIVKIDDEKNAYVVTNSHVVGDGRRKLTVRLSSGRTVPVPLDNVYADPQTDLAIVKFNAAKLPHLVTADFADSDSINVGDWVVAIGSPFGLQQSVTHGIVSAKGRERIGNVADVEMIQTDAAINPGNSGGPLLDLKGRIVGINTSIASNNGGTNMGVGFAIPANEAKEVFEKLIKYPHKIVRGFIGIRMDDLTDDDLQRLGLKSGVAVTWVSPNYPAAEAGIQAGDVVVRYNSTHPSSLRQLMRLVMDTKPGETANIEIQRIERDGKPKTLNINVTVTERPALVNSPGERP